MAKFLYQVLNLDLANEPENSPEQFLNRMGKSGWELVAVTFCERQRDIILYLKKTDLRFGMPDHWPVSFID